MIVPKPRQCRVQLATAIKEFLADKKPTASFHHFEALTIRTRAFMRFCEGKGLQYLADIEPSHCHEWISTKQIANKTRRGYLGDLSVFFNWCTKFPRQWISSNPVAPLDKGTVKNTKRSSVIRPDVLRKFLHFIEDERPEFAAFYALCAFGGIRADKRDSEMTRLAEDVRKDGWKSVINGQQLSILRPKAGKPRDIEIPENLKAWIAAYPELNVPSPWQHRPLAKKFGITQNAFRHSAISAHARKHKNDFLTALTFGTSVSMIRSHYFRLLPEEEVEAFYSILPKRQLNSDRAA